MCRGFSNEQNSHIPIYVELNIVYIGWDTYDKLTKIYAMMVVSSKEVKRKKQRRVRVAWQVRDSIRKVSQGR